jgi:uracil phosphoribosyltransferase
MPANIHVLSHPLVNTRLANLRQVSTSSKEFREVNSVASVLVSNVSEYIAPVGDPRTQHNARVRGQPRSRGGSCTRGKSWNRLILYGWAVLAPSLTSRPQQSPISAFMGSVVKPRVGLTPILRAGLGMTDALLTLFPYVFIAH